MDTKKKTRKKINDVSVDDYIRTNNVERVDAGENCKDAMSIFMVNNNMQRMIPDFKDSLKPVSRRILLTLFDMRNIKQYTKVSNIVGRTMTIHPHGESSIYSAIVGLAQKWNNNKCFIDGMGNYGTIQGDGAAASRYINAKMSEFAWDCFFEEFSKFPQMVDYQQNTGLPAYLPSKYPVIFLNGSLGIGSGYKTDIPPFNFKEICELTMKLMKNPECKFEIYPDMPVSCDILDKEKFKDIYQEGRGSFRMRGHAQIEEKGIRIKSVPYGVPADKVTEEIKRLVNNKSITTLVDLNNYTQDNNVDIFLPLVKGADAHQTLEKLYKYTSLQSSFSFNYAVLDGLEFITDMKDIIRNTLLRWLAFRRFSIIRKISIDIKELSTRVHILEALIKMLTHPKFAKVLDKIRTIKGGKQAVIEFYIKEFGITDFQAKNIAQMAIYELSADYLPTYTNELEEKKARIKSLLYLMETRDELDKVIAEELKEGIKKYGNNRNCPVLGKKDELGIDDTNHTLLITRQGMIKKLADVEDMEFGFIDKGDILSVAKPNVYNLDYIFIFTDKGKVYSFPIYGIPTTMKAHQGISASNYCKIDKDETIIAAYTTTELETNRWIYTLTSTGLAKKMNTDELLNSSATTMVKMKKSEYVVAIVLGEGSDTFKDIPFVYTKHHMRRCGVDEIPELTRTASGKAIINVEPDDEVKGLVIVTDASTKSMLVMDEKNKFKIMVIKDFPKSKSKEDVTQISSCLDYCIERCFPVDRKKMYNVYTSGGVYNFKPSEYKIATRLEKPNSSLFKVRDIILEVERA